MELENLVTAKCPGCGCQVEISATDTSKGVTIQLLCIGLVSENACGNIYETVVPTKNFIKVEYDQ